MWYSSGMDQNPAGPRVAGTRHSLNTIGCQIMPENLHHNPLGLRVLSFGKTPQFIVHQSHGWPSNLVEPTSGATVEAGQWMVAIFYVSIHERDHFLGPLPSFHCNPASCFFLEQSLSISLDVRSLNHRMHLTRC